MNLLARPSPQVDKQWVDLLEMSANLGVGLSRNNPDSSPIEVLSALLQDFAVTDILVNPDGLWVDNSAGLQRIEMQFLTEAGRKNLAALLAFKAGVRLDTACPIADGVLQLAGRRLRLHAVIEPVAICGTLISLRVVALQGFDWQSLCRIGMIPEGARKLLESAIVSRDNLLFSGGTGSGKTTLLGAALGMVAANQRIVCVEQVRELCASHPHLVRLQERAANVSGAGAVSLADLVSAAMRMRPDRIVLGECRGAEVAAVLSALNTGHRGSAATIHANSAETVPSRLLALGALAGLDPQVLTLQASVAFDWIIHLERPAARAGGGESSGASSGASSGTAGSGASSGASRGAGNPAASSRQVTSISRLEMSEGSLQVVPEWVG